MSKVEKMGLLLFVVGCFGIFNASTTPVQGSVASLSMLVGATMFMLSGDKS